MAYIKPPWDDDGLFDSALKTVDEIVTKHGYTEKDVADITDELIGCCWGADETWAREVVLFYFDTPLAKDEE